MPIRSLHTTNEKATPSPSSSHPSRAPSRTPTRANPKPSTASPTIEPTARPTIRPSLPSQQLSFHSTFTPSSTPSTSPNNDLFQVGHSYDMWAALVTLCVNEWMQQYCSPLFAEYRPAIAAQVCNNVGQYIATGLHYSLENATYSKSSTLAETSFDQLLPAIQQGSLEQNLCEAGFDAICWPDPCSIRRCDTNLTAAINVTMNALTHCGVISVNTTAAPTFRSSTNPTEKNSSGATEDKLFEASTMFPLLGFVALCCTYKLMVKHHSAILNRCGVARFSRDIPSRATLFSSRARNLNNAAGIRMVNVSPAATPNSTTTIIPTATPVAAVTTAEPAADVVQVSPLDALIDIRGDLSDATLISILEILQSEMLMAGIKIEDFICPTTSKIMKDAVIKSDGKSYCCNSAGTGLIYPNKTLRSQIEHFKTRIAQLNKQTSCEQSESPLLINGFDPKNFECPIECNGTLMKDPVVAQDGVTYESTAIAVWLATREDAVVSPMAWGHYGKTISNKTVHPNNILKAQIARYKVVTLSVPAQAADRPNLAAVATDASTAAAAESARVGTSGSAYGLQLALR